ncbi:MAG: GNAT family N-acetyltransferase [Eubacteriales bacterium]|jgi:ribosomal protein S18 acetylase RimI-like enzyme
MEYIKRADADEIAAYGAVIRESFATVAREFGLTRENCPGHTSFLTDDRLRKKCEHGELYGLYADGILKGCMLLLDRSAGRYEMDHLAVLPSYRHMGYGRRLVEYAQEMVRARGGTRISIGIIEESAVLKGWYQTCGFIPTGTKRFAFLPFTVGFMEWKA